MKFFIFLLGLEKNKITIIRAPIYMYVREEGTSACVKVIVGCKYFLADFGKFVEISGENLASVTQFAFESSAPLFRGAVTE